MTYNTPELLLVGSAQNLVLGTRDDSYLPVHWPNCVPDSPVPGTSDLISEW